jgi:hypothetical protein
MSPAGDKLFFEVPLSGIGWCGACVVNCDWLLVVSVTANYYLGGSA